MSELTWTQQRAAREVITRAFTRAAARVDDVARQAVAVVRRKMADAVAGQVADVLQRHQDDAPAAGPHAGYVAAEDGGVAVHHEHSPDADLDHLGRVRADLMQIPGIKRCSQSARPPVGPGWSKVYAMEPRDTGEPDALPPPADDGEEKQFGPWTVIQRRGPIYKSLDMPMTRATAAEILRTFK